MEKAKILIIEDKGLLAMQIEGDLLRMGHGVAGICAPGEKALEDMETSQPDLVLMDIKLKGDAGRNRDGCTYTKTVWHPNNIYDRQL